LFEDSEDKTFLFLKKCDVIRSSRQIGKVSLRKLSTLWLQAVVRR
jgi:hypothetical protein